MIYFLCLALDAKADPPDAPLEDGVERFTEELHALAGSDGHLDCSVALELNEPGGSAGTVTVEASVEESGIEPAFTLAMAWVRGALHAAGVPTPGWDNARIQITPESALTTA